MKKSLLILLMSLTVGSFALGLTSEEVFLRANLFYEKGDMKEALKSYKEIEPKGQAVWYNMGNCYYQLKENAEAILCWKRAGKGSTTSSLYDKIEKNVGTLSGKNESNKKHSVVEFVDKTLYIYPFLLWQLLFLIFWVIFSLSLIKLWLKRRYFVLFCLIAINVILGVLLFRKYQLTDELLGIVMKKKVSVFSTPDDKSHVKGVLPQASCINIDKAGENWHRIKYNSLLGWVEAENIEVV